MTFITPFALGSFFLDTALLLSIGRKAGLRRSPRCVLGLLFLLSLGVLYLSWPILHLNSAPQRYALRALLTSGFFLFSADLRPPVAVYLSALLSELLNLIHGLFLTPMTASLQRNPAEYGRPAAELLLFVLLMLVLRALVCVFVYCAVSPEKILVVTPTRVILVCAVTAMGLYTRTIQFELLNASSEVISQEVSVYFLALQLALLLALGFYENYQYKAQDSRALQNQKLMTKSLLSTLKMREESDEAIRRLRHDMKNHMLAIQSMIQDGQPHRASEYIDRFLGRDVLHELRIQTGRPVLDALLSEKLGAAVKQGISVSVVMDFHAGAFIGDFELCMLMGNAVDNAVEACLAMPPDSVRYIEIKGGPSANMLTVRLTNSCVERPPFSGGRRRTTKANPLEHGYGLSIIEKTLQDFGGIMQIQTEVPGRFCLVMSVPVPEGSPN